MALGEGGWGDGGLETTWVGGADGKGAEGGDGVKLENYSLPGQTKGSHSLGLGAATPPHKHPALALVGTAQPRRYGYNTHGLGQCKDVLNRSTHTVTITCTNPRIHPDTQRHADIGI